MTPLQQLLAKGNATEEISFTDADHRYFDPTKPEFKYTSATTLIGGYSEPYDTDLWAMQTALKEKGYKVKVDKPSRCIYVNGIKHSLNQLKRNTLFAAWHTLVLAKWAATTEEACERGNNIHNYLEDTINKSKGYQPSYGNDNYKISPTGLHANMKTIHDLDATNLASVLPAVYTRLAKYINAGCSIFAEKRVRLDLVGVAGMIDVPIFLNDSNRFCIVDWKTNKDELKTKPGYYKKEWIGGVLVKTNVFIETNETLMGSLSHVPASKFNTYALQLSLYAYILECWGYVLIDNGLEIIHMRPNMQPKLLKMPYLKPEIELMMKDRLRLLNPHLIVDIEPTSTFNRKII